MPLNKKTKPILQYQQYKSLKVELCFNTLPNNVSFRK